MAPNCSRMPQEARYFKTSTWAPSTVATLKTWILAKRPGFRLSGMRKHQLYAIYYKLRGYYE